MKIRHMSTKLRAVIIALGVSIAIGSFWGATGTHASAGGTTSIFGTFTFGLNQTGRLILTAPTSNVWGDRSAQVIMLGFDVFRPSTDISRGQQANGTCIKHHMIGRQTCQVTLGPGEAASFDINGDGASSFLPVIGPVEGDVSDLMVTLEVIEGGKIVTAVSLPAVQRMQ